MFLVTAAFVRMPQRRNATFLAFLPPTERVLSKFRPKGLQKDEMERLKARLCLKGSICPDHRAEGDAFAPHSVFNGNEPSLS